jgi:hypothetical protein
LKRKLDPKSVADADFSCFRAYQRSWELAHIIQTESFLVPTNVLGFGLKHRREEVRTAALQAITERIKNGELIWIPQLRKPSSVAGFRAYLRLAKRKDIGVLSSGACKSRPFIEFQLLQRLTRARTAKQAQRYYQRLREIRVPKRTQLFGIAVDMVKSGDFSKLMDLCETLSTEEAILAPEAIGERITVPELRLLLNTLDSWIHAFPSKVARPYDYAKATGLAEAILRVSERRHLAELRKFMKSRALSPPMRAIVLALIRHGSLSDFEKVLQKIGRANERVEFWNHIELGNAIVQLMMRTSNSIPRFLEDLIRRAEFWNYILPENRRKTSRNDLLPIKDYLNRGLFVRLVGYGIIGATRARDADILVRLAGHSYGFLARAAAMRLADLLQSDALNVLAKVIEPRVQQGKVESFANALRFAEMRVFGML